MAAMSNGTFIGTFGAVTEPDDDDAANTRIARRYKPLPLTNFKEYYCLVTTLYSTSLAVILGNSLEWLDFSIYGYSSVEISSQLFGGSKAAYWGSFGLGFAMRLPGAYFLGKVADEKSRKLSLIVSILVMSASTALMSVIPAVCNTSDSTINSYCVSNLLISTVPAICLRCFQGAAAGFSAGGVNVIQSELWSTTERKGAIAQSVGVQNVSGASASMLAAGVVFGLRAALGEVRYAIWGWRIAFLVVVPPSIFASYLMHISTPESNDFARCDGHMKDRDHLVENTTQGLDDANDCLDDGILSSDDESQVARNTNRTDEDDGFLDEDEDIVTRKDSRGPLSLLAKKRDISQSSLSTSSSPIFQHNVSSETIPISTTCNEKEFGQTNATPWWLLISILVFSQFAISGFNNLGVFLIEFAQKNYGVNANTSTLMQVAGKAVQVLMTPFAATLGDIKGWHWTCAFGGALCTILALPMMVVGNYGGTIAAWLMVSVCLPIVSTFWILNAPLLATSVFPVSYRSRGTSLVLAAAAGLAGFLPLALSEIPNTFTQGCVLSLIAALGTIGIIWVRTQALHGIVAIYQRPELF